MIDTKGFKEWIVANLQYSNNVVDDTLSRIKRADSILEWSDDDTYIFYLEQEDVFSKLTVSVKSQLRRAVKLYSAYLDDMHEADNG